MIKCNHCNWSINENMYEGLQLRLENACLKHYETHKQDRILADNFTITKALTTFEKERSP